MKLPRKLQVLLAMICLQKRGLLLWKLVPRGRSAVTSRQLLCQGWRGCQISHIYCWLSYRAELVRCGPINFKNQEDHAYWGSYYLCGTVDMFIGVSLAQHMQTVETKEIEFLKPPKQIASFCGLKPYWLSAKKKLIALAWYRQIVDTFISKNTTIARLCLWHYDLQWQHRRRPT